MPDWIAQTLAATPAFLALIVGVGIPYALLVTPRADWRRGAQIAAVALLIALALLTAWMFVLGMIGALRLEATVAGMIVIAIIGAALIEVIRNSLGLLGINAFWQGTFIGGAILTAVLFDRIANYRKGG